MSATGKQEKLPGCVSSFFVIIFFLFCCINWFGQTDTFRLFNARKYCSKEQIEKTGEKACVNAVANLQKNVKSYQNSLKEKQESITLLTKDQKKACSKKGLKESGTEGCDKAKARLDSSLQAAEELKQKITGLEKEIKQLEIKTPFQTEPPFEQKASIPDQDKTGEPHTHIGLKEYILKK